MKKCYAYIILSFFALSFALGNKGKAVSPSSIEIVSPADLIIIADESNENQALGSVAWFENTDTGWKKNNVLRRKRGMYDKWIPIDLDKDGDLDFVGTRGNSKPYEGVIWLEQVRSKVLLPTFKQARNKDSKSVPFID